MALPAVTVEAAAALAATHEAMRALCLHSFRTNGEIMKAQVKFAGYDLIPGLDCSFADGVHVCTPHEAARVDPVLHHMFPASDFGPYREWWNKLDNQPDGKVIYDRFDECVDSVVTILRDAREQPFAGIIGFSQGGALAATVLAMQMKNQLPADTPRLRFGWIQCAFAPAHYAATPYFEGLHDTASSPSILVSTTTLVMWYPPPKLVAQVTAYEDDPVVPAFASRKLANRFPDATYLELQGRAHKLAKLVKGDEITEKILQFFDDAALESSSRS